MSGNFMLFSYKQAAWETGHLKSDFAWTQVPGCVLQALELIKENAESSGFNDLNGVWNLVYERADIFTPLRSSWLWLNAEDSKK